MKKIDACKLKRKGGFTLVELIVVLVLLSVLSAVAVPTYLGYVDDNKAKQCERNRQALASYLDNMLVTDPSAGMSDVIAAHSEIKCPSGGEYKVLEDSVNNTVYCTCEGHGGTEGAVTVIAKKSSQVTAQSSTEREKEVEKKPEPEQTDPPVKPAPALNISITPNPVPDMEKGQTRDLTADIVSRAHCEINGYEWRSSDSNIVSVGSNGQTVTITAVNEGTCTIYCKANATASAEVGGQSVESTEVSVQVTVNPGPSLSISPVEGQASAYTLGVGATQELDVIPNEIRCKNTSYSWSVIGGGGAVHIEGSDKNAAVTIKADQAGECTLVCRATAISDVDNSTVISSSNEVMVNIKVASLSISVDPSSVSDAEVESTIKFTATPTSKNCTVNGWNWSTSDWNTVKINEGWGTPSIVIDLQQAGSCNITCYATAAPDGGGANIQSNAVTIPVMVKEKETESSESDSLLGNLPDPFLINGGVGGIDVGEYEMVKHGQWYSSDPGIVSCPNDVYTKWLSAHRAGEVDLTYKISSGQSQTVHAKVVYPHTFLNVEGQPHEGALAYNGEELTLTAVYGLVGSDKRSTDRPVEWVNLSENEDIISISTEGENNEIANITANDTGTAKVMARLQNEYTKEWSEVPVEYMIYNRITGVSVEPASLELIEGETGEMTIAYAPSGNLDMQGVTCHYSVNPGYGLAVETMGGDASEVLKVTGNTPGTYTLEVYAQKSGSIIGSKMSCTVVVKPDPNKPVLVQGQNVTFNATKWETLRAVIQSGKVNDSELPLSNLYYVPDENGNVPVENRNSVVYIRKKDAVLSWDDKCSEDMTFEDYYKTHNDMFIEVKISFDYIPSGWVNVGEGSVVQHNGRYYILTKPFSGNIDAWGDLEFQEYCIEIIPLSS